jgi:hypothetical protein
MKCKMAGAKARFVLQTLLARDPEGTPSRALVTKRFQLSFSPSCEVMPCYKARSVEFFSSPMVGVRGLPPIPR